MKNKLRKIIFQSNIYNEWIGLSQRYEPLTEPERYKKANNYVDKLASELESIFYTLMVEEKRDDKREEGKKKKE